MNLSYETETEDKTFEEQLDRIKRKKIRRRIFAFVIVLLTVCIILSSFIGYSGILGIFVHILLDIIVIVCGFYLIYCTLFQFKLFHVILRAIFLVIFAGVIWIFGSELCKTGLDIAQGPKELELHNYTVSYQSGVKLKRLRRGGDLIGEQAAGGYQLYCRDESGNNRTFYLPANLYLKLEDLKSEGAYPITIRYFDRINAIWNIYMKGKPE